MIIPLIGGPLDGATAGPQSHKLLKGVAMIRYYVITPILRGEPWCSPHPDGPRRAFYLLHNGAGVYMPIAVEVKG